MIDPRRSGGLALAYGTEDIDVLLPIDDPDAGMPTRGERFDLRAASRLDDLDVMTG